MPAWLTWCGTKKGSPHERCSQTDGRQVSPPPGKKVCQPETEPWVLNLEEKKTNGKFKIDERKQGDTPVFF